MKYSLPQLEVRTLRICKTLDGFCYNYEVCVKKFLGMCFKTEIAEDKIYFSDKEKIKELMDKNFHLKARKKLI